MNQVREVSFYPIRMTDKGLIGFANLLYGQISLNSIAVYTKPDGSGIRCLYPIKALPNGKEVSLFYPIDKHTSEEITELIYQHLQKLYEKAV